MSDNLFDPPEAILIETTDDQSAHKQERTSRHSMCAMRFDLQWQSDNARHTDSRVVQNLNLWRDIFPAELEAQVMDKPVGYSASHDFRAGTLLENYREAECLAIKDHLFNRAYRKGVVTEPRAGRFYPKGFIAGTRGIFPEDMSPFRLAKCSELLTVDLNHPLAAYDIALSAEILDIWGSGDEHGGACQDIVELLSTNGPGMQARWNNKPTDFWSDTPFSRIAEDADGYFYTMSRMVDHLDQTATRQIERLYGRLVPQGADVLDLMSSWKSHLPGSHNLSSMTGLGMNQDELDANPRLTASLVHDLNRNPQLPFSDNHFDAVICTVSVEYLTRPVEIFTEVNRVLKPGGRFILTFSNRWFPPKVVKIWQDIHEFERPELVLEYFLKAGGYDNLETWSLRGLPRPQDDKYARRLHLSDPVHAVWGEKR